jgi:hypothetical protein
MNQFIFPKDLESYDQKFVVLRQMDKEEARGRKKSVYSM